MTETTLEEAMRCPKCEKPGVEKARNQSKGAKNQPVTVITVVCMNELCPWYEKGDGGGGWLIQLNPDGSIPQRESSLSLPKQFMPLTPEQLAGGQRRVEDIVQQDLRGGE